MKHRLLWIFLVLICACRYDNEYNTYWEGNPLCQYSDSVSAPAGFLLKNISYADFDLFLKDFQFASDSVVFALGELKQYGYVGMLKSLDGGRSWVDLNVGVLKHARNMIFKDQNEGFISIQDDSSCTVLKTIDGGDHWETMGYPNLKGYFEYLGYDAAGNLYANLAYIGRTIMKSKDNGISWDSLFPYKGIVLFNDKIYASGEKGKIFKIDTDGHLLDSIETNQTGFTHLFVVNENVMFLENIPGLFRSVDGGKTWSVLYDNLVNIIDFSTENEGIIVKTNSFCPTDVYQSNDAIAYTGDGGKNWVESTESTNLSIKYETSKKLADGSYVLLLNNEFKRLKKF